MLPFARSPRVCEKAPFGHVYAPSPRRFQEFLKIGKLDSSCRNGVPIIGHTTSGKAGETLRPLSERPLASVEAVASLLEERNPAMSARVMCIWIGLTALCASGGCAAFAPKATPKLTAQLAEGAPSQEKPQGCIVEFHDSDGRRIGAVERPLTGTMHVQELLKETRALSKWRKAKLDLIRQLPTGGEHRMKMEYSLGNKRVDPENDYQLHVGDRIIVTEDPSTVVDEMLQKLSPGTATMLRGNPKSSKYEIRN
jgi:hypothetical protein